MSVLYFVIGSLLLNRVEGIDITSDKLRELFKQAKPELVEGAYHFAYISALMTIVQQTREEREVQLLG